MAPNIRKEALALGFDVCRVTSVDTCWDAGLGLAEFVEAGHHGEMAWMKDTFERRKHPQAMWPDAKSAVVVGLNYGPDHNPLRTLEHPSHAAISVYAQGKDYHDVLKKRLKQMARAFAERTGEDVKVFVDTAPLMEKPLAAQAGLGWQGKHTNLVSREKGSWLFLGVMLTTAELTPDEPEVDHCGSCRACLDICPTKAFPTPYKIDARRCISYLTIENKGPIPLEFRVAMGNRIYGCDDCLAVCPWNKFAETANEAAFFARAELKAPELRDLVVLDDPTFREVFSGSPIKRIGRDRFVRNVLIAIGNSRDIKLTDRVIDLLDDPSPLVRGTAIWALGQLSRDQLEAERVQRQADEKDPTVLEEWRQA